MVATVVGLIVAAVLCLSTIIFITYNSVTDCNYGCGGGAGGGINFSPIGNFGTPTTVTSFKK